jgi:hypothetical protein
MMNEGRPGLCFDILDPKVESGNETVYDSNHKAHYCV